MRHARSARPDPLLPPGVPIESLRLRFALLQSLNTTLETFFLPLVELRQTPMYTHSIAALLKEAKGQCQPAQLPAGAPASSQPVLRELPQSQVLRNMPVLYILRSIRKMGSAMSLSALHACPSCTRGLVVPFSCIEYQFTQLVGLCSPAWHLPGIRVSECVCAHYLNLCHFPDVGIVVCPHQRGTGGSPPRTRRVSQETGSPRGGWEENSPLKLCTCASCQG